MILSWYYDFLVATYDGLNRALSVEADRGSWTLSYGTPFNEVTGTDGGVWRYYYDSQVGITTRIDEPTGGSHIVALSVDNDPIQYTDPSGVVSSWTFDSLHRPKTYTPPTSGGQSVQYQYHGSKGWVTSVTNVDGSVTLFQRNIAGHVLQETRPDGSVQKATYSSQGDRLSLTRPNGNVPGGSGHTWAFAHDTYGQLTSATDPLGREFLFEYTLAGDVSRVRRPDREEQGQVVYADWSYTRDDLGNIIGVTNPLGETWSRSIDSAGRLSSVTGPLGYTLTYSYDDRFRPTTIHLENGDDDSVVSLEYDGVGRLSRKIVNGDAWEYEYDLSSRVTKLTDPLGREWSYARNPSGQIQAITYPGGQVFGNTYDTVGRLVTRALPGGETQTWSYDSVTSELVSAQTTESEAGWIGGVNWTRDTLGRPLSVETFVDDGTGLVSRVLSVQYDADGNVKSLQAGAEGELVDFSYDELDRPLGTVSDLYPDWTATYDPYRGHRTGVVADDGTTEQWSFDAAGRRTSESSTPPAGASSGSSLQYDAEGRVVQATDTATGAVTTLSYTPAGFPSTVQTVDGGSTMLVANTFDPNGRLVAATETLDGVIQSSSTVDWDAAGRLLFASKDESTRAYLWTDTPDDPNAVFGFQRVPSDRHEENIVELSFDDEGRIRRALELPYDATGPSLQVQQRWLPVPFIDPVYAAERDADGDLQETMFLPALHGPYAETTMGLQDLELANPFQLALGAQWTNELSLGGTTPRLANPLEARAPSSRTPVSDSGSLLASLVTGQIDGRDAIAIILGFEQAETGTLTAGPLITGAFIDDWAKGTALGDSIEGAIRNLTGITSSDDVPAGEDHGMTCYRGEICVPNGARGGSWECSGMGNVSPALGHGGGCHPYYRTGSPGVPQSCNYHLQGAAQPDPLESQRYPEKQFGVSLSIGEFTEQSTDLTAYDPTGAASFVREYRSQMNYVGSLGHRWVHNWGDHLLFGHDTEFGDEECGYVVRWVRPGFGAADFFYDPDQEKFVKNDESFYDIKAVPNGYEIRGRTGAIRVFNTEGRLEGLRFLGNQQLNLVYENDQFVRLTSWTPGYAPEMRLELTYYASGPNEGLIETVTAADGRQVHYDYQCGDLIEVRSDDAAFGYDLDWSPIAETRPPTTLYTYATAGEGSCDAQNPSYHLMASKEVARYDPVLGVDDTLVVVHNVYSNEMDWSHGRVTKQCFGVPVCDESAPGIEYQWWKEDNWINDDFPHETLVIDRMDLSAPVSKRYEFLGDEVRAFVEDVGGTERTTIYQYGTNGLLARIYWADGTCVEMTDVQVGGSTLIEAQRVKEAAYCNSWDPGPTDKVTFYTYEGVTGKVRTVTTPGAFPGGVVPTGTWSPSDPGFREYTTFYDYDLNQTAPGESYPDDLIANSWGFLPEQLGDLNGDPSDDDDWFGAVVRVRNYVLSPDGASGEWITSTQLNQSDGRPIKRTNEDGTKTYFAYYDPSDGANSAWDWRTGGTISADGRGPLAAVTAEGVTATLPSITNYTAYDPAMRVVADQDGSGRRIERTLGAGGRTLYELTCAPMGLGQCTPGVTGDNVLVGTQYGYDLAGNVTRTRTLDLANATSIGTGTELQEMWSTFTDEGWLETTTIDPDPGVLPGSKSASTEYLQLLTRRFYDPHGLSYKVVSPAGRVTCSTRNQFGKVVSATRHHRLDDDTPNCPASHAFDVTETMVYDLHDRLFSRTNGTGYTTYSLYDWLGQLSFAADGLPLGAAAPVLSDGSTPTLLSEATWYRQFNYSDEGVPVRERFYGSNGKGDSGFLETSWFEIDSVGRVVKNHAAVADGFVPLTVANSMVVPTSLPSDVELLTRGMTYAGVLSQDTYTVGGQKLVYGYDDMQRVETLTYPPSVGEGTADLTTLEYDAAGRIKKVTRTEHDPLGVAHSRISEQNYDAWGRVERAIDGPGSQDLTTDFTYDALGRQLSKVIKWNHTGLLGIIEDNDRSSRTVYDAAGRVTVEQVLSSFDAAQETETWDTVQYGYDADGLITQLIDQENRETDWSYKASDGGGTVGGIGVALTKQFPVHGGKRRTLAIVDFDANGKPTTIVDSENGAANDPRIVWDQTYDTRGRLEEIAGTAYDLPTGVTFLGTDRMTAFLDDLNRVVKAIDTDDDRTAPDREVISTAEYDTLSRAISESITQPGPGGVVTRTVGSVLDLSGFREELRYPTAYDPAGSVIDDYVVAFGKDPFGRLSTMTAPTAPVEPITGVPRSTGVLASFQYVGGRLWDLTHGNGVVTRHHDDQLQSTYDDVGRLIGSETIVGAGPNAGELLLGFQQRFDPVGNVAFRQKMHEPIATNPDTFHTRAFATDLQGRLAEWSDGELGGLGQVTPSMVHPPTSLDDSFENRLFQLDQSGNWTTRTITLDAAPTIETFGANEIDQYEAASQSDGQHDSEFDWVGHLIGRDAPSGDRDFRWDVFGRLTEVVNAATPNTVASYRYDAGGRRVERQVWLGGGADDPITHYVYDGWNVIEERTLLLNLDETYRDVVRARYGHAPGLDNVLWMDRDVPKTAGEFDAFNGEADELIESRFYVHEDLEGNVTALTNDPSIDGSPQVEALERFTYSPYGETSTWTGEWSDTLKRYNGDELPRSIVGFPFLYSGRQLDPETGFYYYRNRYYDPSQGKFISRDPSGMAGGINLYSYGATAPHHFGDPLGLSPTGAPIDIYMPSTAELIALEFSAAAGDYGAMLTLQALAEVSKYGSFNLDGGVTEDPCSLGLGHCETVSVESTYLEEEAPSETTSHNVRGGGSGTLPPKAVSDYDRNQRLRGMGQNDAASQRFSYGFFGVITWEGYGNGPLGTSDGDEWFSNWASMLKLYTQWVLGIGNPPTDHIGDNVANAMRNSSQANDARDKWYSNADNATSGNAFKWPGFTDENGRSEERGRGSFGPWEVVSAGVDPIEQFMGSVGITIRSDGQTLTFTVTNTTSLTSASYGLLPSYTRGGWLPMTPFGNMDQTLQFTEPIDFDRLGGDAP